MSVNQPIETQEQQTARAETHNMVSSSKAWALECRQDSLRKTVRKVSSILVTLTSHNDSDFERSNVSLKENKPDGGNPNSNDIDYHVRKNEGKFYGFWQTE